MRVKKVEGFFRTLTFPLFREFYLPRNWERPFFVSKIAPHEKHFRNEVSQVLHWLRIFAHKAFLSNCVPSYHNLCLSESQELYSMRCQVQA